MPDKPARIDETSLEPAGRESSEGLLHALHRLATTRYTSVDAALSEYLRTGCEILRLPTGAVTAAAGDAAQSLRAIYPPAAVLEHTEDDGVAACAIAASIPAGDMPPSVLSFWSTRTEDARRFSAGEREMVELMAAGLGRLIREEQLLGERTQLAVALARQVERDPLTGLANRVEFMKHLDSALAEAKHTGGPLAVAFLDLDRFKQVNDTLGHAAGDQMLKQVASRLAAEISSEEWVARVGGDEFTVLFVGNPTRSSVAATAQRLIEALRAPYRLGGTELFITASIGISFFPDDAKDAWELVQKADAAMYRSKSHGRNDFQFFTPDLVLRGAKRMELETELRRALEKGEMRMCFMPLVAAETGTLAGLEALLQWRNPRFGNVGPSRFIPIAEESGMIVPIGAWVLSEVCRLGAGWQSRWSPGMRLAVNVSPLQFGRPDFVDLVSKTLGETGLPPQCLELELTESAIMRDVDEAVRRLAQLREVGVSISIDDFGTGYSSLSYLRRLPADTLKVDQSFVAELGVSSTALPLIHTIVVLAHNIGLSVVAEGVETREQADLLRVAGCDKLQGHLFGIPLTPEAVEILMDRPSRDVPFLR